MKYVLLGQQSAEWLGKHEQRNRLARAKAKALGIKIVSVLYTQGRYDFVDVVEAPSPEAMLNFSVWYASQGFGSFQSMPAFDGKTMAAASKQD
ncbi:MAG: GYD domain-containing protein [Defluviicoccus sp.]|nr:GYD domain-containing protein [Defluviicoccus sp.]